MDATSPPPNRRPSPEQAAWFRKDNARKWRRWHSKRYGEKPKDEDFNRAPLRFRDLQTWFRFCYGGGLPDDDAGRDDIAILIGYAVMSGKPTWPLFETWTPWLDDDERERIVESATRFPIWHTDDELARRLRIQYQQRQALGITSFSSVDVDLAGCKRLRRQRDKERKKQDRATAKQKTDTKTDDINSLKPRQKVVLSAIGETETTAASIVEQVKGHRAFRGLASVRQEVHRILDRLREMGLVVDRSEPRPQGSIRYVKRRQQ
jgi:hypothetical protein